MAKTAQDAEERPLRILVTGFVSATGGSVLGGNAVLLAELLRQQHEVRFFSKPEFVDPRLALGDVLPCPRFKFVDTTNGLPDMIRRRWATGNFDPIGFAAGRLDHHTYVSKIVRMMRKEHEVQAADVVLWMGTAATGRVADLPVVSFLQGPPGTDAESLRKHRKTIDRLAGSWHRRKLEAYARWRMTFGLPNLAHSDALIVGSDWSRDRMSNRFGIPEKSLHALPYPVDLKRFKIVGQRKVRPSLRVLWLGRFVPRKRLDLFLAGLAAAIQSGVNVEAMIVGRSSFVPGYEQLIAEFPFRERIEHVSVLAREEIPKLLGSIDLLVQPSDDENFGSSVAEAQACGLPVVVGATNGTSDYICSRSIRLADDRPETLALAFQDYADRKASGSLGDVLESRQSAEAHFDPAVIARRLVEILHDAIRRKSRAS